MASKDHIEADPAVNPENTEAINTAVATTRQFKANANSNGNRIHSPFLTVQQPTLVSHFLERADSFFHAAFNLHELNELEGQRFGHAIGLLAVHSAIALADAVLVAVEGSTTAGENHAEAARKLRKWCSACGIEGQGLRHFEWLLGKKNHFSYGARPVTKEELGVAEVRMEQFFAWAFRAFPDVAQLRKVTDA